MIEILILLGQTYFNKGFVNIPIAYDLHFGIHHDPINVYLGNRQGNPIQAWINRTYNLNGTPRIKMGANYTHWVRTNHALGDNIVIILDNLRFPGSILIQ